MAAAGASGDFNQTLPLTVEISPPDAHQSISLDNVKPRRMKLGDDYSRYKFGCEENQTHLHIQGILRKQEKSESSKAPGDNKKGPLRQREKETHLIHEKMDNVPPPLTGKDVEDPGGLFSTELKVYKVRGAKTAIRQRKRESDR